MGQSSSEAIGHHRFSPDIRHRLRPCFRRDNWRAVVALVEDWTVILAAVTASMWAWQSWPLVPAATLYGFAVLLVGSRQRALATLLHDSAHRILARNRRLNVLYGTLLSGYLVGQSFTGYVHSHVHRHHGQFGDPVRDPDYADVRANGLYGPDVSSERVRRYLRRLIHPRSTWRYIVYLTRYRMVPLEETRTERALRLGYLLFVAGLLGWAELGAAALLYWIVPLLTTANWIGGLLEFAEHYPYMELGARVDIYMSRNRLGGPVAGFLLGVHHESYHLIHHLFPAMPSRYYPRAHRILMDDPVYASVNGVRGWAGILCELTLAPIRRPVWWGLRAG